MTETKRPKKPDTGGAAQACPVAFCPVGMFLTLAGQARPEVLEHLMNAGRELVLAATAVLDARAEQLREQPRVEKIDIR